MPWIRLDSAAFVILYLVFVLLRDRRVALVQGIVYASSLATLLGASALYFGDALPQTVIGKSVSYSIGETSITQRLDNAYESVARLLLPLNTRFLNSTKPLWFGAALVVPALAWWRMPENRRVVALLRGRVMFTSAAGVD